MQTAAYSLVRKEAGMERGCQGLRTKARPLGHQDYNKIEDRDGPISKAQIRISIFRKVE